MGLPMDQVSIAYEKAIKYATGAEIHATTIFAGHGSGAKKILDHAN
jgi:hypothetical protein